MSEVPDCCICVGVLTRPVSLPCRHVFCLPCIGEYWRLTAGSCQCPLCKALFPARPDLRPAPSLPPPPAAPLGAGEVPCNVCSAGAVRSCLACLASYCAAHLEPHYREAALWRHPLVAATKNGEEDGGVVCRHHGRPADRFCRSDRTRICVVCTRTDHRDHRVVVISREADRTRAKLQQRLVELRRTIQERTVRVEDGRRSGGKLGGAEDQLKAQEQDILDLQQRQTHWEELLLIVDPLSFLLKFRYMCSPKMQGNQNDDD